MTQTNQAAFETVIETHLLANGYVTVNRDGFDWERAIFSETVLAFIRATQAKESVNLDARRQNVLLSCLRSVVPRL
jgi:type I restriction enzyme, R subunit